MTSTFSAFTGIDDYDYLDLYVSYHLWDERVRLSLGVDNLTDEEPPILGNESGDTSSNFGNTYPSNYDACGRSYTFGARLSF